MNHNEHFVGYSCAYTPLPLIHAAGLTPYRILPMGDHPDQAGSIMHDNLCPHVKRILDRAMAKDLPELSGIVFMESCESMRRLADAWEYIRPSDRRALIPLPFHTNEKGIAYLSKQLKLLAGALSKWSYHPITTQDIAKSMRLYSVLARQLNGLAQRAANGELSRGLLQAVFNRSVTQPVDQTLSELAKLNDQLPPFNAKGRVPVLLFGNVLPDPEALALFEDSGCLLISADMCTGDRQHAMYHFDEMEDPYIQLARSMLNRPFCARTIAPLEPGILAKQVVELVQSTGARGVIGHVMKFCDPYLGRMPLVFNALKEKNIPYLILEGNCTLRSFGQYRTRAEAFVEMLG
ncbi:MAG: 2-hydroxyacyl-CoA dehydratase [Deltaproteobacteria bacterium]|nr:2-hydroxyacyl-CoA dehydratase [Deltaproteobacteria bacterium]